MKIDDLYRYCWVSDPHFSPDGQTMAYVKRSVTDDREGYRSCIWLTGADGKEHQQFTSGDSDSYPRFSPDGKQLAFLSDRGDQGHQIWVMLVDGGEARQLTSFEGKISGFKWSPDGSHIAFTGVVNEEFLQDDGEDESDDDVRIITRMRYKLNGADFTYDKFAHLFVVCSDSSSEEEPVQVTDGAFSHNGISWSPDGKYLATSATRCPEPDYADFTDVYLFPADGSVYSGRDEPLKVTDSDRVCRQPSFGPSGERIFHVGHDNEYASATIPTVALTSLDGGKTEDLLPQFPTGIGCRVGGDCRLGSTPADPIWDSENQELYYISTAHGKCNIYGLDVTSGEVRQITQRDWAITGFTYNEETSKFAIVAEDAQHPGEIWVADRDGNLSQVTRVNSWLDEVQRTKPHRIEFTGAEGASIEGWILPPVGCDDGDNPPLVLQIHGGPHSAYGYSFYHEFHVLAAKGYGVLYINPHGSRGYGQQFNAATHHDWGGKDYEDLMKGLNYTLKEKTYDEDNLGVCGGSFGGYMVNWIIGQTTEFSAAVTMRSTCNRYSMFGTSDIGFNNGRWEFPGNPWDNPEGYLDRSPISHVSNVQTPILIVHAENDLRCPISQAEEWYTALKRLKKEVVFARFPDENHELSRSGKPTRRIKRLELIVNWLDKYL